jgi:prepilin-type N-terminal cleavage/methylation domain-containing protein
VACSSRRGQRGVALSFRHARRGAALFLRRGERGVTLIELLIVMTLIALLVGVAYPSASAGIDNIRLRSTADNVVNFLNAAIDHAERRQQLVEVWISPKDNVLIARSPDQGFARRFQLPEPFHITAIRPEAEVSPDDPRRFLMYPGGTVPRLGIEITGKDGKKREVNVDPLTGMPRNEFPASTSDAPREQAAPVVKSVSGVTR